MKSYKKINIIVIIICLFLIGFLSIGYSVLQQYLEVTSNITLRADKEIRIINLSNPTLLNGAYEVYNSNYTEDTITNNIVLPNLDSSVSYTVTIRNNSTVSMEIEQIIESVFDNNSFTYDLDGLSVGSVLTSSETKNFTITYRYKNNILSVPDNNTLGSIIEFKYKEYIVESFEYATGGMLLHLRGSQPPINDKWIDSYNPTNQMTLNNVTYNEEARYYDFINGYASLGSPIIPRTGDFTVEVYLRTPLIRTASDDKAIISQISDTVNSDPGRFKLGDKQLGLSVFYSQQRPISGSNANPTYYFTNLADNSSLYLVQYVREGEYSKLYLNGMLTNVGYGYPSSNYISQGPFKIARFNNNLNQHFDGQIYSVRVYNRALSNSEIINNYENDVNNYAPSSIRKNLYNYAIANHVVSNGNGLYNTGTNSYVYKGSYVNNYLRFEGDNNLYQIISFNDDGTVKLFNTTSIGNSAFDASGNRTYYVGGYCDKVETLVPDEPNFYGCNYYSTTTNIDDKTVIKNSTIKDIIDAWYDNLSYDIRKYIVKHDFEAGIINEGASLNTLLTQSSSIIINEYVALLGLKDFVNAFITPPSIISSQLSNNYLFLSSNDYNNYWLLNGSKKNTYDVWSVNYGDQVGPRRASRTSQIRESITADYNIKPSFYIYSDIEVTGEGSMSVPFIVPKD